MAKGRRVVADQNSEELDSLRRLVHTMLLMLRNLGNELDGCANAAAINDVGAGLAAGIDAGLDADATGYVGTGLVVEGVIPSPKHPRRPSVGKVEDLDPKSL